ncbi:hypothetical protein ACIHEI_34110 [Kitasatospora sp. NPDC051984]|uniref:hypothetical protein n=1 Tax=Kitasatospora sp. NPDC051984 TaxID=3364059 RepID=UPI0037CBEB7C
MNSGDGAGRPGSVAELALRLPEPSAPVATTPVLIETEKEMLARCEAAVDALSLSFWLAGKALQIVRDGRLYREKYESFEDYTLARWGMQRNYANKLIRTWRIAEAVFDPKSNALVPIGTTAAQREKHEQQLATIRRELNQATVWELVAVAEKHSPEIAAGVLGMVVEANSKPTAAVVKRAVRALPGGEKFDPKTAKAVIREELAKPATTPAARPPRPRQEQQPAAPHVESAVAWDDPAAVYALLLEKMTADGRAALATLLIEDISSPATPDDASASA